MNMLESQNEVGHEEQESSEEDFEINDNKQNHTLRSSMSYAIG